MSNAAAPFNRPKADIILRSSDNVDFRIFKFFLSLASSFFEALFDIPQPTGEIGDWEVKLKDGLVVIPVMGHSKTLDALLRFCYPCTLTDDPNVEALEDVLDLLEVAQKYSLDLVEKKITHTLSNPKVLEAEPFRCFAIARRPQLQEETLLAAKYALAQPLVPSWFPEINLITAVDLLALLTYHRASGKAVYAPGDDMSWIIAHYGTNLSCAWLWGNINYRDCSCPRSPTPQYRLFGSCSPQWWEDFMMGVLLELREKPCGAAVTSLGEKTVEKV